MKLNSKLAGYACDYSKSCKMSVYSIDIIAMMDHCIETSDYLLFVWGHSTTCWEIPLWLWLVFVALALWHGGQKHRMVIGSCSGVVKVHFCLDIFGRKLLFNRQRIWCFGLSLLLLHWKRAGLLYVALHGGWLCLVWGGFFLDEIYLILKKHDYFRQRMGKKHCRLWLCICIQSM